MRTNGDIRRSLDRLGLASYESYTRSPKWQARKQQRLARETGCLGCGTEENLQLHHVCYKRLGRERDDDLLCLCRTCHEKLHLYLNERMPWCAVEVQVLKTHDYFRDVFGHDVPQLNKVEKVSESTPRRKHRKDGYRHDAVLYWGVHRTAADRAQVLRQIAEAEERYQKKRKKRSRGNAPARTGLRG